MTKVDINEVQGMTLLATSRYGFQSRRRQVWTVGCCAKLEGASPRCSLTQGSRSHTIQVAPSPSSQLCSWQALEIATFRLIKLTVQPYAIATALLTHRR